MSGLTVGFGAIGREIVSEDGNDGMISWAGSTSEAIALLMAGGHKDGGADGSTSKDVVGATDFVRLRCGKRIVRVASPSGIASAEENATTVAFFRLRWRRVPMSDRRGVLTRRGRRSSSSTNLIMSMSGVQETCQRGGKTKRKQRKQSLLNQGLDLVTKHKGVLLVGGVLMRFVLGCCGAKEA